MSPVAVTGAFRTYPELLGFAHLDDLLFGGLRLQVGFFQAERSNASTAPQRNHLTHDAQRDLFRSRGAQVETGRCPDTCDPLRRHAFCCQVIEHQLGAVAAGNQSDIGGVALKSLL